MNLAEITLIGTGGYGECVLINLGNDNWIIVDSCINPEIGVPQSTEYLESINVDLKNVKLIVCTHWHDDHILGISQALEKCSQAKLSFSKAHDKQKFLYFLSFDYQKKNVEKINSSTFEFNKCIDIIDERNSSLISAVENKCILNIPVGEFRNQIISLSPSDYTMEKFDHEISSLITEYGQPNKKMPTDSPNAKSVALFLKIGHHRAILGADLEVSLHPKEGWKNIVTNNNLIDKKSSLFKIPHHGSENGFCGQVWDLLLEEQPIAKITPWNRGNGLPQLGMLKKYSSLTDKLFMTAAVFGKQPKKRDKQIEKFLKKIGHNPEEVKFKKGVITCKIDMDDPNAKWEVTLVENSLKIEIEID